MNKDLAENSPYENKLRMMMTYICVCVCVLRCVLMNVADCDDEAT